MTLHDQDPEVRGFYFANSGRDTRDGATIQRPKKTVQAAIDATGDLSPVPDLLNQAQVSAAQGGSFSEGFVLPGFVNFDAMNAIFSANQAVSVTLGEAQICRVNGVRNSNDNSTCFLFDGLSLAGVQALFCSVAGDDSIGFEIKGTSEGVFGTCDRLTVGGARSIGVKITGTFVDPVDFDADVILLNGADAVYVDYNPTNVLDACVIDVSSVFSSGATVSSRGTSTSTAYIVRSGHLTIKGSMLIADVAIEVKSGGEADLRQETVVGNIIVDSGGVLNVDILDHKAGTITNNGVINGIIDGVPFGTFRQKHQEQRVLNAKDFTIQGPTLRDVPHQVLFGPAQVGPGGFVEIDALGNIKTNRADQYTYRVLLEYGRTNAGSFSRLIFRILVDGTQLGDSQYAQIDTAKTVSPIEFSGPLDLLEDEITTFEIIRDLSGFNDGSLFPFTPSLAGVSPAPSAVVMISRNILVQPI